MQTLAAQMKQVEFIYDGFPTWYPNLNEEQKSVDSEYATILQTMKISQQCNKMPT